jgi:hypothetical protein
LLGLGSYFLAAKDVAAGLNVYLQAGNILNKYDPDPAIQGSLGDSINAVDNQLGLGNDIGMMATKPSVSNGIGFIPDFIGVQATKATLGTFFSGGSLMNIPLNWIPDFVSSGGVAAVVQVSFAADQMGFSYADQLSLLLKAAPYFTDFLWTLWSETNPNNSYDKFGNWFNKAYGSANQNEYP